MLRLFLALSALLLAGQAVLCPPGSQCATNCGNVLAATSPDDLVCDQQAFKSDPAGQLFAGCVDCQRSSIYHAGNDSDIQSMLYNVRYALSYCVWGSVPVKNPKVVDTPCITSKACGPFKDAVQFKNLSAEYDAFQHCDIWPTYDTLDFQGCTDCLQAEGRYTMANFVTALQAGCQQKPAPGFFIGLDGEIFSTTAVQLSTPSPTSSINPAWFDNGPLSLGAKVGIAIGSLIGLLILLGCGIVCNGKRRRRAYLRNLDIKTAQRGWPSPNPQREMDQTPSVANQSFRGYDDTPLSQRPLRGWDDTPVSQQQARGWDDSPMSANSDQHFPRYFSPYSSQYNSPVSAQAAHAMQWPHAALTQNHQTGVASAGEASATHFSSGYEDKGKSKVEAYEMHEVDRSENGSANSPTGVERNVTPVLGHPGYGRHEHSPPAQYTLTDYDARHGNAI
ncbi:hypothetical protein QQS21_007357 [Conoideocrella luteorostrata]|uniref:Centromere/microtubule binding protein cbf5-like protein n=1 Tax=Conoideocrella luteorostrata TaxID=1105319 RepID=A0AAJ0CKZ3_9HYPO|nr:hypothetical protein QQS21_007357 [Conoideocrella luteorostrata]